MQLIFSFRTRRKSSSSGQAQFRQHRHMGGLVLVVAFTLLGCRPSAEEEAKAAARLKAEAQRQEELCRDRADCGEKPPAGLKVDYSKHALRKWNNHWFLVPRDYDAAQGMGFLWPLERARLKGPSGYDPNVWAIELHIRSHDIPPEPRGYVRIQLAEREGRVSNRVTLRPGLDRLQYRYVDDETGKPSLSPSDVFTEYVATDRRDPEGQPPVLRCKTNPADPKQAGGGGGFMWRDGIYVEVLIRAGNICEDWPAIYDEVIRVLQMTEKV